MGETRVITWVLKSGRWAQEESRDGRTEAGSERCLLLALTMEERGHKARNEASLWKLGKARNESHPDIPSLTKPPAGAGPVDSLLEAF